MKILVKFKNIINLINTKNKLKTGTENIGTNGLQGPV